MAVRKGIMMNYFVVILILLRAGLGGYWEPTREAASWI